MSRILVVDDEAASVSGLRTLLELDGHAVTALVSSRQALDLLTTVSFDAVITDLEMPEVSGIDIVRAARGSRPATPVFVVTGYTHSPAAAAALAAGARAVLDKPLDFDALDRALRAAILAAGGA